MSRGVYNAAKPERNFGSKPTMPGPTHSPGEESAEGGGCLIDFPRQDRSKPSPKDNNLPLQLTSFVGREREIAGLEKLLVGEARLVTLTGPGGSGKTRLALAVAAELSGDYEDGVWWVELASLSDPDLVPQAVANALGINEAPGRSLMEALVEYLEGREVLLLLDNCEHLVEACAALCNVLLHACPKLRILATSREALGVAGERNWPVPSLSLPDPHSLPRIEELGCIESVRLFVERARSRRSDFTLDSRTAPSVAEVCRGLDGIPLAIELAAARVGALSVTQISGRLEHSLGLLSGRDRTSPERQRTLRGALDWSYELLDEEERELFGRLSVFAGGFTLDAAEAVCAGDEIEPDDVLDLLGHVMDKSLVVAEAGAEGALRYRMLEPVRQYGWEKLQESGKAERTQKWHAEYYLALAEEAEPELSGANEGVWLERLEAEHGNLRAALGWSLADGDAGLGLRLAGVLGGFWYKHGHLSEGRMWLHRELAESSASPAIERATALDQAGWIALYQGDLEPSVALLDESLSLFKELKHEPGIAASLAKLGHAVLHQDDDGYLAALCEEAEALRRAFVDRRAIGELIVFLGMVALYEGDLDRAITLLDESLGLFRELASEPHVAPDQQREGIRLSTAIDLVAGQAQEYLWLAVMEQGDHRRAVELLEEELRLSLELGNKPKISYCLLGLAAVAALQGRPARAVRLWVAAETLREEIGLGLPLWDHTPTDYQAILAATRSQLDAATWETARTEGRAMSPERAVEYALRSQETPEEAGAPPAHPAGLSAREVDVLKLVARGMTNAQVARELFISPNTVNRHLNSVYRKIGSSSRAAATRFASEHNLL
jgi:predicted ATPase/DNA-binding CsgD family transcriptional regulator